MEIEEIFDRICQHFVTKRDYFKIFGQHLLAMEDWVRGEIVWLMHQSPMKEQEIFIATNAVVVIGEGKKQKPDLRIKISSREQSVELKALVIDPDSPTWDFDPMKKLVDEFGRLVSRNRDWFISLAYPLKGTDKWKHVVEQSADKADLHDYYVRNLSFDIGDGKQCLISLFGLHPHGNRGHGG